MISGAQPDGPAWALEGGLLGLAGGQVLSVHIRSHGENWGKTPHVHPHLQTHPPCSLSPSEVDAATFSVTPEERRECSGPQ